MNKQNNILLELALLVLLILLGFFVVSNYQTKNQSKPMFCGGVAVIPCPEGYFCNITAKYPDAGGTCTKKLF